LKLIKVQIFKVTLEAVYDQAMEVSVMQEEKEEAVKQMQLKINQMEDELEEACNQLLEQSNLEQQVKDLLIQLEDSKAMSTTKNLALQEEL
jgi:hypothetical protein